ncbi:unnamed protein product [Miscanthus lutarioriparius]|uniref:Uncharacterized protein n=1 Tax=Miscanthus lutarioriparius TaxID=422564 RepID=A0A811NUK0_9POAL|nr:unnamed protein product [Miscanthus lutarioriparius]
MASEILRLLAILWRLALVQHGSPPAPCDLLPFGTVGAPSAWQVLDEGDEDARARQGGWTRRELPGSRARADDLIFALRCRPGSPPPTTSRKARSTPSSTRCDAAPGISVVALCHLGWGSPSSLGPPCVRPAICSVATARLQAHRI